MTKRITPVIAWLLFLLCLIVWCPKKFKFPSATLEYYAIIAFYTHQRAYLCRVLQQLGVFGNESHIKATAVHFRRTMSMRKARICHCGTAATFYGARRINDIVRRRLVRVQGQQDGPVHLATAAEPLRGGHQRGRWEVLVGAPIQICRRIVRIEAQVGLLLRVLPVIGLEVDGGPAHEQHFGQQLHEHPIHPGRHPMRLRWPKVDIQHHHCYAYTANRDEKESKRERDNRPEIDYTQENWGVQSMDTMNTAIHINVRSKSRLIRLMIHNRWSACAVIGHSQSCKYDEIICFRSNQWCPIKLIMNLIMVWSSLGIQIIWARLTCVCSCILTYLFGYRPATAHPCSCTAVANFFGRKPSLYQTK